MHQTQMAGVYLLDEKHQAIPTTSHCLYVDSSHHFTLPLRFALIQASTNSHNLLTPLISENSKS